jgi:cytochrome c oxidase subunit 1
MLFVLAMIAVIGTGGLGGIYLGTAASDVYFHDTYFVVGHFHLMIGMVTFLALYAGLYYWFPKMFGRMMNDRLAKVHFWMTFVPMFLMFVLMHFQGFGGAIRRSFDHATYDYTAGARTLHHPITFLAVITVVGQFVFLANFAWGLIAGRKAEPNPWDSAGLEWSAPTPVPHGNWGPKDPVVYRWPYDYTPNGHTPDFVPQTQEHDAAAVGGAS